MKREGSDLFLTIQGTLDFLYKMVYSELILLNESKLYKHLKSAVQKEITLVY